MKKFIEFFLSRSLFINLLNVIVLIVGFFYMFHINKEAFPNINFDIVTVTTIYPGASSSEVEKLVTIPIEVEIKGVSGIDKIQSTSLENLSAIAIWIDPDEKDTQKVIYDIRSAVDRSRTELPTDVENPLVLELTSSQQPVIEIALGVKDKDGKPIVDEMKLRDYAYQLERQFLNLKTVARVERRGWRDREMIIELSPEAMQRYYVSSGQVITAVTQKNLNLPGGKLMTPKEEYIVRTLGEVDSVEEIRKIYVRSNDLGDFVRIQDIAKVTDGFDEREYIERSNGLMSISLTVVKKEKADIIKTVQQVKEIVAKFQKKLPPSIVVSDINDLSYLVKRRLDVLVSNAIVGTILVIASLFLFLSWRMGVVVAAGMITALAGSFIYIGYTGVTLNLLTMFGLVMVVGMIVDDAIVVAENIFRYLEDGMPVWDATVKGTVEVIAPVTATITTTVAAFAPLMYMSGIFGKFVYFIPFVVIVTLVASLIESFLILPSHVYDITPKKPVAHKNHFQEKGLFIFIRDRLYVPTLSWALRHRILTFAIMTILFVGAIGSLRMFGSFKLFPEAIDRFFIKFEAPKGYSLKQTNEFAREFEKAVAKLGKDELEDYTTSVGIISKGGNDPSTKRGTNYGMVILHLTPEVSRKRKSQEIIDDIRRQTIWMLNPAALAGKEKNSPAKAKDQKISIDPKNNSPLKHLLTKLEYEKIQGGPPVGKAVSVEIRGRDFSELHKIGNKFKVVLKKMDGVVDVEDDMGEGKTEIRVKVDERLAAYAGVSVASVASAIRTAFEGTVATSIRKTDEEIEIRVRFPESYRKSIHALDNVYVSNATGQLIPVTKLSTLNTGTGILYINHLDSERVLRIQANVNEKKTTSAAVNAKLKKMFTGLEDQHPGYTISFGGENEDTEESMRSLARAFGIAVLIIFLILASLFKSIIQPAIVMAAIPFAFIGVITAFVTHGHPFSFMALMGVVGLAGVVVNDSIVLVDFANTLLKENPNMPIREVAKEAGKLRLRAVILTTITTVLGLLPTAYGIGGYDPFLVPSALAFAWGLSFSTIITLVLVPILYTAVYDLQRIPGKIINRMRRGKTAALTT